MAQDDTGWSEADREPPRRRKKSRAWLGWSLFVLMAAGTGAFVYYLYLPLRQDRARLEVDLSRAGSREKLLTERLKQDTERFSKLSAECDKVAGELKQTVAEKARVESELETVQTALAKQLEPEIQTGNVRLRRRGQELVLDMADDILFDKAQAEVSEGGQKLLGEVGKSLLGLSLYSIQVAGHTDSTRVVSAATQERFPTNWELSTARATNVVRFLQERAKIPGNRLAAAGFAEFRPSASNASEDGRRKNRRIEILLVPAHAALDLAKLR
jgi:chemotaxis protein MotB